jgi:hypothetical protein
MSDNEWSSDEEINEVPEQKELNMLEYEEDSDYEDERQYILSLTKDKIFDFESSLSHIENKKNKKNKKKVIKPSKKKIIIDIYTLNNEESNKKKWISKRMKDKRLKEGKVEVTKRKFNPKLPLPTFKTFKKEKQTTKFTSNDFPTL